MDPTVLLHHEWSEIGKLLFNLWVMVGLIIAFATSMLFGHVFIPSLVATYHLPPIAQKARPLFYAFAIATFALAIVLLVRVIGQADVIARIYEDYWI